MLIQQKNQSTQKLINGPIEMSENEFARLNFIQSQKVNSKNDLIWIEVQPEPETVKIRTINKKTGKKVK